MSTASGSSSTSATAPDSGNVVDGAWDDMLLVGMVARTHGNKGEVIVNATTDFADIRFAPGAELFGRPASGRPECLRVQTFRMHQGRPIVGFAGSASITEAERFAGWELRVPAAARQALPAHVYYHHDLIGCEVRTGEDEVVGVVKAIDGDGQAVRLVIATAASDVLVPFTQAFCEVDVAARRIVVRGPEGLLEANGAWRA